MGACAEQNSPEWVCIQEVTHYRSWFLFLPHSTVISGLWLWFRTIWEWFPMFLWRLSQEKHCGEIESIMGNHVEPSSPLWVCILQKSLAITRDFWNANSPRWTLLCTGAHNGFFMEYKLMRVNSVPHGHPAMINSISSTMFFPVITSQKHQKSLSNSRKSQSEAGNHSSIWKKSHYNMIVRQGPWY